MKIICILNQTVQVDHYSLEVTRFSCKYRYKYML